MLSDYSSYVPGYTGFIPKLQSIVGETYGNATRKLLSHQAKLLRLSHSAFSPPGHRYRPRRPLRWPASPVCVDFPDSLPTSTKRSGLARRLIYDGAPQTTSAIQSIEKVKADLKPPPEPSVTSQLSLTKPTKNLGLCGEKYSLRHLPLDVTEAWSSVQTRFSSTTPSLPPDKSLSKTVGTTISKKEKVQNSEEMPSFGPKKREALRKQRGKLIYRPDCGLLPNYTGYVPGHKFSFGKTWGASTRDSLGAGKRQPLT